MISQKSTKSRSYTSSYRYWENRPEVEKPPKWYDERKRIMSNAEAKVADKPPTKLQYGTIMRPELFETIGIETRQLYLANLMLTHKLFKIGLHGGKVKPFMIRPAFPKTTFYERKELANEIQLANETFYEELVKVEPRVPKVSDLNKQWRETEKAIAAKSKYPLHWIPQTKLTDKVCGKRAIGITRLITSKSFKYPDKRPRVMIEISHEIFGVIGRMTAMLYSDYVPKTCQNFLALCRKQSSEQFGSYHNCQLFRIFPKYFAVTGDVVYNNGLGGQTIYGSYFENENFLLKHSEMGILSMYTVKEHKNSSQFLITFRPLPALNQRFVAFGKIIENLHLIMDIESYGTEKSGYPKKKLRISNICEV